LALPDLSTSKVQEYSALKKQVDGMNGQELGKVIKSIYQNFHCHQLIALPDFL
jgi:hypothetical protein